MISVTETFMICVCSKVRGLCRKVGVMEFGLYHASRRACCHQKISTFNAVWSLLCLIKVHTEERN